MAFWTSRLPAARAGSEPPSLSPPPESNSDTNPHNDASLDASRTLDRLKSETGRAALITLLALACAVYEAARYGVGASEIGLLCVAAPLLLTARALPLTAPRERRLTLLAPFALALTCWLGALPAGLGTLLACAVYARIGTAQGNAPDWSAGRERVAGARLLVSCCAASWTLRGLGLLPVTAGGFPLAASPTARIVAGGLGGLTFILCLAACYVFVYTPTWNRDGRPTSARLHLLRLGGVTMIGLLAIMALAPLEPAKSAITGLGVLTLLMLSARLLRLHNEARDLHNQLAVSEKLSQASVHALEATDGIELLSQFLELSDRLVRSERALVWVFHAETNELTPDVARPALGPFQHLRVVYNEGVIGRVAAQQEPRLVLNAGHASQRLGLVGEEDAPPRANPAGAWLLYPLVMRGQLLGVAHWTRPAARPFTPSDIARLEALVTQAAFALENLYVRAQMQDLASQDGLTGLWNHKRLYELLREEMRRAARYHRALCVLMMDVDSFKTFNDTYGHPRGDDLLRVVANVLQNSVRDVDHVGRYGGEEFLIVLPETSKDAACGLAERIRAEIEANAFVVIRGEAVHRTLSIGVASYPEDAINPAELVEKADAALYRAKRSGKNRVHWA